MSDNIAVYNSWEEYELRKEIMDAIAEIGFETPSFIQKTAIAPILMGRDVRAQAQSGTGKTAAFAVSLLQKLDLSVKASQVLVLVPTREMAVQNAGRIRQLATYLSIKITTIMGGSNLQEEIKELKSEPEVIVATPGRMIQMLQNRHINTEDIKLCVIDEADEMLSRGFEDQIREIFTWLDAKMQVAMFSATWDSKSLELAQELMNKPLVIDLRQDEQTLKGISQYYVDIGKVQRNEVDHHKLSALIDIYKRSRVGQCIIFVNSKMKADFVCNALNNQTVPTKVIHAGISPAQRNDVVKCFREGSCRLLVSTEVLSRGIDIQQLSVVINFDLPLHRVGVDTILDKSNYIHRIGRAGRYGRKGTALTFISHDELKYIHEIQDYYRTSIQPLPDNLSLQ